MNGAQHPASDRSAGLLRGAAVFAAIAGAVGSLAFLLYLGQRTPRFLLALFVIWVLSPFAAFVWATAISKRWAALTRATLYVITMIVALASLASYGNVVLGNVRARPAAIFLMVPLASLLVGAIALSLAAYISGRQTRT